MWESGYLWHLKAALTEDLSFAFFSRYFLSLPAPHGPGPARGLEGQRRYGYTLPSDVHWGLRLSPRKRCNGRARASGAGLTSGRGPPAAGARAAAPGLRGGLRAEAGEPRATEAGAALAGGLRRAPPRATKDGQRVGRRPRPRPRRPLVRVRVPRS